MPNREGDLSALVQRFREGILERLSDNARFHDALDGDDDIRFEGLGSPPNEYLLQRHKALLWIDPEAYRDELQRWQEAADRDQNEDAINHLTTTKQLAVFRDLVQTVKRGRIAPFIGAGSSACLGFPLWRNGLSELADQIEPSDPSKKTRCDKARLAVSAGDYIGAGAILYTLDRVLVDNYVATTYSVRPDLKLEDVSGPVRLLPDLADGCIITTNFDDLIERVFRESNKPIEGYMHGSQKQHKFAVNLIMGDRCILKLHGDAADSDTYIFSKQQYDRAYGKPLDFGKPLARALRQIYVSHSLLFIGCSLAADRTLELFEAVTKSKDFDIPSHFAILEQPADAAEKQAKANRLLRLKVRAIWYGHGDHAMVERLVRLALNGAKGRVAV